MSDKLEQERIVPSPIEANPPIARSVHGNAVFSARTNELYRSSTVASGRTRSFCVSEQSKMRRTKRKTTNNVISTDYEISVVQPSRYVCIFFLLLRLLLGTIVNQDNHVSRSNYGRITTGHRLSYDTRSEFLSSTLTHEACTRIKKKKKRKEKKENTNTTHKWPGSRNRIYVSVTRNRRHEARKHTVY